MERKIQVILQYFLFRNHVGMMDFTGLLSYINALLKMFNLYFYALGKLRYLLLFRSMWFRLALLGLIGLEALAQGAEAPVWATSYSVQG